MDLKEVDPVMLKDICGAWKLRDIKGSKCCSWF
jgi:hypothetical protein